MDVSCEPAVGLQLDAVYRNAAALAKVALDTPKTSVERWLAARALEQAAKGIESALPRDETVGFSRPLTLPTPPLSSMSYERARVMLDAAMDVAAKVAANAVQTVPAVFETPVVSATITAPEAASATGSATGSAMAAEAAPESRPLAVLVPPSDVLSAILALMTKVAKIPVCSQASKTIERKCAKFASFRRKFADRPGAPELFEAIERTLFPKCTTDTVVALRNMKRIEAMTAATLTQEHALRIITALTERGNFASMYVDKLEQWDESSEDRQVVSTRLLKAGALESLAASLAKTAEPKQWQKLLAATLSGMRFATPPSDTIVDAIKTSGVVAALKEHVLITTQYPITVTLWRKPVLRFLAWLSSTLLGVACVFSASSAPFAPWLGAAFDGGEALDFMVVADNCLIHGHPASLWPMAKFFSLVEQFCRSDTDPVQRFGPARTSWVRATSVCARLAKLGKFGDLELETRALATLLEHDALRDWGALSRFLTTVELLMYDGAPNLMPDDEQLVRSRLVRLSLVAMTHWCARRVVDSNTARFFRIFSRLLGFRIEKTLLRDFDLEPVAAALVDILRSQNGDAEWQERRRAAMAACKSLVLQDAGGVLLRAGALPAVLNALKVTTLLLTEPADVVLKGLCDCVETAL